MTRILVLSSVLPVRMAAGELLLYRHLSRLSEQQFNCMVAVFADSTFSDIEFPTLPIHRKWLHWIAKTPLRRWLSDRLSMGHFVREDRIDSAIADFHPDVLLTVAHGELFHVAFRASARLRIPLVTLYHDWWPDKARCSEKGRDLITKDFLSAAIHGTSLSVCDGMHDALQSPSRGQVLYPIHEGCARVADSRCQSSPGELSLGYAGNLTGIYGEMIKALSHRFRAVSGMSLRYVGIEPTWMSDRHRDEYDGFVSPKQAQAFLSKCDFLLVMMPFHAKDRRKSETSFPSKIVDYCLANRPILIWGPPSCSAVRWAKRTQAAIVVENEETSAVYEALREVAKDPQRAAQIQARATALLDHEFSAEHLQSRFEKAIQNAAEGK